MLINSRPPPFPEKYRLHATKRNQTILRIEVTEGKEYVWLRCGRCSLVFRLGTSAFLRNRKLVQTNPPDPEREKLNPYSCKVCLESYRKKFVRPQGKGADHPNWKGGGHDAKRRTPKYKAWRNTVLYRDKGLCFLTRVRTNVVAHHLDSWSVAPEKSHLVSNGISLATELHTEFHQLYSKKTNCADFEKYCSEKYDIVEFPWAHPPEAELALLKESALWVPLSEEEREAHAQAKAEQLGISILVGSYTSKSGEITISCPRHAQVQTLNIKLRDFCKINYVPLCCTREPRVSLCQKPLSQKGEKRARQVKENKEARNREHDQHLRKKAAALGHTVLEGAFEASTSIYKILCPKHNLGEGEIIQYQYYVRNKNGLSCCAHLNLIQLPIE